MNQLLILLSEASERQIDPIISIRLKALVDHPTAAEMRSILNSCARYSLASDFAMAVMHLILIQLERDEAK